MKARSADQVVWLTWAGAEEKETYRRGHHRANRAGVRLGHSRAQPDTLQTCQVPITTWFSWMVWLLWSNLGLRCPTDTLLFTLMSSALSSLHHPENYLPVSLSRTVDCTLDSSGHFWTWPMSRPHGYEPPLWKTKIFLTFPEWSQREGKDMGTMESTWQGGGGWQLPAPCAFSMHLPSPTRQWDPSAKGREEKRQSNSRKGLIRKRLQISGCGPECNLTCKVEELSDEEPGTSKETDKWSLTQGRHQHCQKQGKRVRKHCGCWPDGFFSDPRFSFCCP